MKKLACIVGTRPEAIKLAPVVLEARKLSPPLACTLIGTGQHRDLVHPALTAFGLRLDHELDVMQSGQSIARLTGRCLEQLDGAIAATRPDLIAVQGDTASAFAGAMAGFYSRIPVAHVEAGLRTGDLSSPFPEESNRCLIARLASLHFAPTHRARANLLAEGVAASRVIVTGNTVLDAIELLRPRIVELSAPPELLAAWESVARFSRPRLVVVTIHRRESFGAPLERTCAAIRMLALLHPELHFVVVRHLNPRAAQALDTLRTESQVTILPPQGYLEMLWLLSNAWLVLTDSGGLQEEAPSFGVPVLVLRERTERLEGVDAGLARLVGTSRERIVREVQSLLRSPNRHFAMRSAANPYGDGRAARRIVAALSALDSKRNAA